MARQQKSNAFFGTRTGPVNPRRQIQFDDLTIEQRANCASKLAAAIKLFANPHRLRIVSALVMGERSVSQLQAILGKPQPSISNDLSLLGQLGILESRQVGKSTFYVVKDDVRNFMIVMLADLDGPF